ncbi:MAG TPA: AEC family transporter [Prolixibacteraceae bacterium]|nr:AEC family transporter [Prolixibacteraceae bacterium]
MSSFFLALHTILPLFLIIFFGIVMIRIGAATPAWVEILNKYALLIGFPALIFAALAKMEISFAENATLIYGNSLYLIGCMLMAFPLSALFKTTVKTRQTLILVLAFGNITYLGIPVLVNTLGQQVMGAAVILTSVYLFWMFSLALVLIEVAGEGKIHFKTMLIKLSTNPLLIAVVLGIIASNLKISPEGSLMKSLDMIAQSVTAVVLLSLGIFMGSQKIGSVREWVPVFGLSLLIMVVFPGIFYIFLKNSSISQMYLNSSILDAAMPMGLTAYALTQQYGLNPKLAGRLVLLSTFLSMFILPAWIAFLMS